MSNYFPYDPPGLPAYKTPAVKFCLAWFDTIPKDYLYAMTEYNESGLRTPEIEELMNQLKDLTFLLHSGVLNEPKWS